MNVREFLFLELEDECISFLLSELRYIFMQKKKRTNIHVTIKGPQKNKPRVKSIHKFLKAKYPLKISGANYFNNDGVYIVYLKVILDELKSYQLWYKPDFPDQFNPHITIYEGDDLITAMNILDFLSENIKYMSTTKYNIISYKSHQPDLFSSTKLNGNIQSLINDGVVPADIFIKAKSLMLNK